MAQETLQSEVMLTTSPSPLTALGVATVPPEVPLPTVPLVFTPQHCAVPSDFTAQMVLPPPCRATAPVIPDNAVGVVTVEKALSGVGSASMLPALPPQHATPPTSESAQVCVCPPLSATGRNPDGNVSGVPAIRRSLPVVLPF